MRANLKPWLILAVIFVAGGVTGAALTVALSGHFLHPPPPPGSEVQMRDHWLARLTWQLKLTSDQQAKIEPILGDAAMRIQTLHHQEVDKVAQIFKETDDKISGLLNDRQRLGLIHIEAERQRALSNRLRPWGPQHDRHYDPEDAPPPPGPENAPPPGPNPPPTT